jgi:threonylcarbamoyladenosine tRNA methylthiotransferase MtaB
MKRKYSIKEFANLCKYIHKKSPYASITTDYIVGFPTETITDFKQGCKQLTKLNFSDMHLFPYSSRPFTPASKMKNLVSDSEKKNRFLAINDIRKSSEIKYLKQFINKEVNVLFEKPSKSHYQTGHSEYFFKVDVQTEKDLRNNLLKVKIIELIGTQLYGKLL